MTSHGVGDGEKLTAIIRRPGYGCRDLGRPCLFFDTYVNESVAALQVFEGKEADRIIKDSGVYNVNELEGRACWVQKKPGSIVFLEMWRGTK